MLKQNSKIICVGFHKTGLTSLFTALQILGYKVGKGRIYKKQISPATEVNLLNSEKHSNLLDYIEPYTAILDNPWNILFKEIDLKFPNSKFIFTYRKEENWLKSAKEFFALRPDTFIRRWVYGVESCNDITNEIYLERYRIHNEAIKKYFEGRENDLLVLNLEAHDGWEKLCPFLNKPIIQLPFPKQNTNTHKGHLLF